jgi:hypothetical protein
VDPLLLCAAAGTPAGVGAGKAGTDEVRCNQSLRSLSLCFEKRL